MIPILHAFRDEMQKKRKKMQIILSMPFLKGEQREILKLLGILSPGLPGYGPVIYVSFTLAQQDIFI